MFKPKPMVEIGGQPILWHIMMHYYHLGFDEFIIVLGYKGDCTKRWIKEYYSLNNDVTVKTGTGEVIFHDGRKQKPDILDSTFSRYRAQNSNWRPDQASMTFRY